MADTVDALRDFLKTAKAEVDDSVTILPWHDRKMSNQSLCPPKYPMNKQILLFILMGQDVQM